MVDYIIVGGGVYGCAVAWELASRGFEVRLLEAGEIAGHASGGPGRRGVRANGRDRTELPLMEIAYDVWPHLHQSLGSAPFYERTGHLLLVESAEHLAQAKARGWMQRKLGINTRLVEGDELREMEPALSPKILAALFCPKDGIADHAAKTRAYGTAAKKLGAGLDEHCEVTSFALEDGRIQSVTTQNEEQLSVGRGVFLLSNTAVTEQVRQLTGDVLPVWNACLQVLVSEPLSMLPLRHLIGHMGRTVSLKKEGDDRLMISGGWPDHWDESTQTGGPVQASVSGNVAETVAVYPALAGMGIAETNMKDKGVGICSVRQGFDTSTSMGEMMFQFVGILSSWEREMIRERTLAGLERAKSEGKTLGRRKVTNDRMTAKILELRNNKRSIRQIASVVGVSRGTVSNILKDAA